MLIIFDTETTGIGDGAGMLELASLIILSGRTHSFQTYCNPGVPISEEAFKTHGIGFEKIQNCLPAKQVALRWMAEIVAKQASLNLSDDQVILIGHNTVFDRRILSQYVSIPFTMSVCTMRLARRYSPGLPSHRLSDVYASLGSDKQFNAHSALDDVQMTGEILRHYCTILAKTPADLAVEQQQPYLLKTMPFGKHKDLPIDQVPAHYMRYMLKLPDLDMDVYCTFREQLRVP